MNAFAPTRAGWRLRSATFSASALVVAGVCVGLWWFSRVIAAYDTPAVNAVQITLARPEAPRPSPRRLPPPLPPAPSDAAAPATETTLPVDAAMLARTLACSDPHPERRPENCPRAAPRFGQAPAVPPSTGFGEDPLRLDRGYSVAERATLLTPSCKRDGGPPGMVSICTTIGRDPPPPSRSAEEICEAGGIGPCHPPEFRPEDVVHQAHTN